MSVGAVGEVIGTRSLTSIYVQLLAFMSLSDLREIDWELTPTRPVTIESTRACSALRTSTCFGGTLIRISTSSPAGWKSNRKNEQHPVSRCPSSLPIFSATRATTTSNRVALALTTDRTDWAKNRSNSAIRACVPGQIRVSVATASRSAASSRTDASICSREKSLIDRPCTISYCPFRVVTGNDEMRPSGTP